MLPLLIAKITQAGAKCFDKFGQAIGRRQPYEADVKNLACRLCPH
jgi:hypothetical protein